MASKALLQRAAMTKFQYNTNVVRSTDDVGRVLIATGFQKWGDCVCVMTHKENNPGIWHFMHFSPARARIIAEHLLKCAAELEKNYLGMKCIDKEN